MTASERSGQPLAQARIGCASEPARNRTPPPATSTAFSLSAQRQSSATSAPAGICGSVTLARALPSVSW
jgi:hypothetical protein